LRERVHPPLDFTSTSENWPHRTCRAAQTAQHLPRGFLPLRDISSASPRCDGLPTSHLCSARSVSHALDGLLLALPCGPISSHCHVQDLPFRGFPRCPADSTHRRVLSCPHAVGDLLLHRGEPRAPDPFTSTSGLCSEQRSVATGKVFSLARARSPLRLCSLGLHLQPPGRTPSRCLRS